MHNMARALDACWAYKVHTSALILVLVSSNRHRLTALFFTAAKLLLDARKSGASLKDQQRLKAVLDLVRARKDAIRQERPTIEAWASLVQNYPSLRVVVTRRAA
jgi:hypothetical protein